MTIETTATCEARVGFYKGEWAEMPLWCSAKIGLTTWTDTEGQTRKACRHHLERMLRRFPRYVSEIADDGLGQAKAERERVRFMDPREREIVIESNDGYEVTVDEDDEWTNREGMPEFNGSFR